MSQNNHVDYQTTIPEVISAMGNIHSAIDSHQLDRTLYHLILLLVSQMNDCRYCIAMHTREALEDGESEERLQHLNQWRESGFYSPQEKAVFEWAELVTRLDSKHGYSEQRQKLRDHFSDTEISVINANLAMINLWNRIQISGHQ